MIKNALIFAHNNTSEILNLAKDLVNFGKYRVYSTGDTFEYLKKSEVEVVDLAVLLARSENLDSDLALRYLSDPVGSVKQIEHFSKTKMSIVAFDFPEITINSDPEKLCNDKVKQGYTNLIKEAAINKKILASGPGDYENLGIWVTEQERNFENYFSVRLKKAEADIGNFYQRAEEYLNNPA